MRLTRISGRFATIDGAEYLVVGSDEHHVWLLVDDEAIRRLGPSVVESWVRASGELSVKVLRSELDRYFSRSVDADVGGAPVFVAAVEGDQVHVIFLGDRTVAKALGLSGDQHDGWSGSLPSSALGPWRVSETELSQDRSF